MTSNVARGITGTILFKRETTYGSRVAATKDIGLVQTCTINPDSNIAESQGVGQAVSIYTKPNIVNVKGSIEFEWQHGRPLEWAIYGGTTTHVQSGASGDWTHTLVWSNSLPSLSGEVSFTDPDVETDYTSLQFGSSTISCTVDGILKMRGDFVGQAISDTTVATAAVVNAGAPLGGFEGSLSLGGSTVDYVQSWEVTINRNTKTIFGMGDRMNKWGASNLANVSWKATIGLENVTQIGRLLSTAGTSISTTEPASFAAIFQADNGISLGSGRRELSMAMAGCQIKSFSVNLTKGDFTLYDISGSGTIKTAASCTCVDQIVDTSW